MAKRKSTKHTYKTKDRVTQTTLKTGVNSCFPEGRVSSSCSASCICRVNLVRNSVMNEEWTGKYLRQVEHIRGHLWHIYYMLFSYQTGYIMWHSRLRIYIPWGAAEYIMWHSRLRIYIPWGAAEGNIYHKPGMSHYIPCLIAE